MLARRIGKSARIGVGLVAAGLLAAGCSGASGNDRPAGPGELLTSAPLTGAAALPSAASTRLITYRSEDAQGRPIVVSGTVAVPKSPPPDGGWPVLSWAHGTTGFADTCAPSVDSPDGLDHDYLGPVSRDLDTWVARGYAVVQTDYEGLGTPGGHTYINGTSEANTVTDIVRAARALDSSIGRDWVVAGHSQGGQATLFTAQNAGARAPELHLKGAVSIAPGGVGLSGAVDYLRNDRPGAVAAEAFLPVIVLGAQAADPAIDPDRLLSPQAAPLLTAGRTGCLAQIRAVPPVPPAQVFAPDADVRPLTDYLDKQDPSRVVPAVPTMIAQGTLDTAVAKPGTDVLVKTLCDKGVPVDYRVYDGQDHRGTVPASLRDAQDFADRVVSGQAPAVTCSH
ncbi:putative secreted lipase [Nocardia nova SH22a]|uniref:Putative secreted lipase n=1 Tax=Nocardia nova SH22a TaxID=1415166 RepID=W5TBL1_9NOCA|nr:lipase family protein [Nocardia nova]AHH16539.1 putative secreted lipase [Nocardia nova SH22a]